jgi:Chitobiase/beta-hexosaminidase C-terminal domain
MPRKSRELVQLLVVLLALSGRVFATTAIVSVTQVGVVTSGTITLLLNVSTGSTATETVTYGPNSTPASIAAAFGLMFTRDYISPDGQKNAIGLTAGVNCGGLGTNVITFALTSGTFGALGISGSTDSFNLNASGSLPMGFGSVQQFAYAGGALTMSTTLTDGQIFYTTDGSAATEASIQNPGTAITLPAGTNVNAVVVQTTKSGNSAVIVQNGQNQVAHQKTVVSCSASQCGPFSNTPTVDYGAGHSQSGCLKPPSGGADQGVCGVPTAINYSGVGSNPTLSFPNAGITGNAVEKDFSTAGQSEAGGPATQVLWPYNYPLGTNGGCDTCTTMVEDFYIWPEYTSVFNPGVVQNYELDLNQWDLGKGNATSCDSGTAYCYGGASMQDSIGSGNWQYNDQSGSWQPFPTPYITQDLVMPFGTTAVIGTANCSTTAIPLALGQTSSSLGSLNSAPPEPGMIIYVEDNSNPEEIFVNSVSGNSIASCIRGYGGTTVHSHSSGTKWVGSVHVQYHATLARTATATSPVACSSGIVFID